MDNFEFYKNKECKNMLIHGGDIVLINKVVECSDKHIIVDAVLDENIPFLDIYENKKILQTYKCIEMMAQSLGCFQYINMAVHGQGKIKIGFLLGARKFDIYSPYIECSKRLFIETKLFIQNDDGFGVYESTVYKGIMCDDMKVVSATLSVLSPQDDFMEGIQNSLEGM